MVNQEARANCRDREVRRMAWVIVKTISNKLTHQLQHVNSVLKRKK